MATEIISETPETPPIWESERSELYFSAPGIRRYVIWECSPNGEGVKRYDSFGIYDPLPHHYYASDAEYEAAKRKHASGGEPDILIDVEHYPLLERHVKKSVVPVIPIFDSLLDQQVVEEEKIAA
jgi:hypothetical protein